MMERNAITPTADKGCGVIAKQVSEISLSILKLTWDDMSSLHVIIHPPFSRDDTPRHAEIISFLYLLVVSKFLSDLNLKCCHSSLSTTIRKKLLNVRLRYS